jgi:radical SAM protein with 4Fe4S-binding SPASM domain
MVEIADRCNEACVHCYQIQGEKGELETEHWERIFRELAELGVLFLTISGGEATLRKDFLHLVEYARSLRFAVKIFSNGLKITDEMAARLGELSVQEVQISLYSHRADVHDSITRVPGSFDQVLAAARALRAARVKVVLKSPLMVQNAADFGAYVDLVTSLGADYSLDPKLNPRENGDNSPTALAIDKRAYLALRNDARFAGVRRARPARALDSAPCAACASNVHVEPNGELRPCTQWSIATGDALATSLRDAWYGDPVASAIRRLSWNDLPGCKVCDLRGYCQRCFADAERSTGDALAPYPRACMTARWKYEVDVGVEPEIDSELGWCSSSPLGPFRHAGEHRFLVEHPLLEAPELEGSSARQALAGVGRPAHGLAPDGTPARPWLPASAQRPSPGLIQLRRRATGPALTPSSPSPSGREG